MTGRSNAVRVQFCATVMNPLSSYTISFDRQYDEVQQFSSRHPTHFPPRKSHLFQQLLLSRTEPMGLSDESCSLALISFILNLPLDRAFILFLFFLSLIFHCLQPEVDNGCKNIRVLGGVCRLVAKYC